MKVKPFSICVEPAVLTDLCDRLLHTRWPDEINDDAWDWGTRSDCLRKLVDHWATDFDWRAQETALNRLPQFRADIDGLGIHFVHIRGKGPNPTPLIITHGWPGSFVEMRGIIPLLTDPAAHGGDPADAFDLVIPSLPGYGFSDRPTRPGMSPAAVADLWVKLMHGLRYPRFGAQGGDWGAAVSTWLAILHPDALIGLHLNFLPAVFPPSAIASAAERAYFDARSAWTEGEGAYGHQHGTKPQTLAYGLTDSPVGLAAWILEKFRAWSDCGGDPLRAFTADDLLTNISIYWFTETISSSIRLYKEARRSPLRLSLGQRVLPPMGFAQFPVEIPCAPRDLVSRFFDVHQWTAMPRGGHFAAMEQPVLLAADVTRFFRSLRAGR